MTVENRYLRCTTETVGGTVYYRLLNSEVTLSNNQNNQSGGGSQTVTWGILVYRRQNDGTITEITSGTPIAQVTRSVDNSGIQSNTWDCPETALVSTDRIIVRVYVKIGSGSWLETTDHSFITEVLNASQLDAYTWTVYYYTERWYDSGGDKTYGFFSWGDNDYESYIYHFSYTPYVATTTTTTTTSTTTTSTSTTTTSTSTTSTSTSTTSTTSTSTSTSSTSTSTSTTTTYTGPPTTSTTTTTSTSTSSTFASNSYNTPTSSKPILRDCSEPPLSLRTA